MRIWSLHPSYLDTKGLLALWREALLAKHVLLGQTKGYTHHPQLERFIASTDKIASIDVYLQGVIAEAKKRGYAFDERKVDMTVSCDKLTVTTGQIVYERMHLSEKLLVREPDAYNVLIRAKTVRLHPLFKKIGGKVESWEKV
jgi:hypothetical protein